jgi:hypothetical protein
MRAVQLFQTGLLLLCSLDQLLSLDFQLEGSRWWLWRWSERHGWKRPHMDFHCNALPTSFNERAKTLGSVWRITTEQKAGQITLMVLLTNLKWTFGLTGCYFR